MSNPTVLVQKLWNYCNILRDDGLSYGAAEVERRLSVVEELEVVVYATLLDRASTRSRPARSAFGLSLCEIRLARSQPARIKGESSS